jgi:hypothetical protein
MRKIHYFIFTLFLLSILGNSCREDYNDVNTPVQVFHGKTVLVYMAADNSLSNNTQPNIDSMMAGLGKDTTQGNLLIYMDRLNESPILMQLTKSDNGTVSAKTVKTYTEQNSASATVLSSVFKDITDLYPSESYGLVLWSHGYGWISQATVSAVETRWWGQDGGNVMELSDLAKALQTCPHLDYILFDACLMSGVEVAYELRNYSDYIIGSPTEVLAEGFPYSQIVSSMFGNSESDYIRIASMFYEYYNAQSGYSRSASVACVKCSEMEALATRTSELINAHIDDLNNLNVSSVQYLENYSPHLFYDFEHFIEQFTTELERYYFKLQLDKTIIYKANTDYILSGSSYSFFSVTHCSGLNTYIPSSLTSSRNASYQLLEWYSATGWSQTIW